MTGRVLLLAILMKYSEGAVDITFSDNPVTVGDSVVITCTKSPTLVAGVSWFNDRYLANVLSFCLHSTDQCTPSTKDERYLFSSDIANRKFTMTITKVEQADAGVYTCKDSSPDEGQATLQVQTGKTKDDDRITNEGVGVGVATGVGVGIIAVLLVVMYFTGLLPGCWRNKVRIPNTTYQNIEFEDWLNRDTLNKFETETSAILIICGEGSAMYDTTEHTDQSVSVQDQPLHVFVTAILKIRVNRAVQKIRKILNEAIRKHNSVSIPEEEYPDIKFDEVLSPNVIKSVEQQTRTKIFFCGKGSGKYGKTDPDDTSLSGKNQPLEARVTESSKKNVEIAVEKIKAIIKTATSKNAASNGSTSKDATSKEATSKDATSKDASSKDAASKNATGKDATSKVAANKNVTSKNATSKDSTSKDATSKDAASKDATSKGAANKNVTSKDATSKDAASKDATSKAATSKDATSMDAASKDATSKDVTSKDAANKNVTSKDAVSKDATSKDAVSKNATSKAATSKDATSMDAASKDATSKDVTSKDAANKNVTSKDAVSKDATSKDAVSKDAVSKDATSKDAVSKDAASKDATSMNATSKAATSKDAVSKDATSKDFTSKDATSTYIIQKKPLPPIGYKHDGKDDQHQLKEKHVFYESNKVVPLQTFPS